MKYRFYACKVLQMARNSMFFFCNLFLLAIFSPVCLVSWWVCFFFFQICGCHELYLLCPTLNGILRFDWFFGIYVSWRSPSSKFCTQVDSSIGALGSHWFLLHRYTELSVFAAGYIISPLFVRCKYMLLKSSTPQSAYASVFVTWHICRHLL